MQPTPTNRLEDLPEKSEDLFADAPAGQGESTFGEGGRASDGHGQTAGSLETKPASPRRSLSHTIAVWVLPIVALACLAVIAFVAMHGRPVDERKIRGPGDEAAPNAPPDYKQR